MFLLLKKQQPDIVNRTVTNAALNGLKLGTGNGKSPLLLYNESNSD
ncbi:hypothetical protein ACSFXN_14080 [Planococcus sp. 1R117A]